MKFSAIIPAYNEWPRIAKVLSTLLDNEKIDEIIVIDDGSTDNTRAEIEKFSNSKIKKIFKEKNEGKARAVLDGAKMSFWEYIVMVDSDLIGLQSNHIDTLIRPIIESAADATLSIRENSLWVYKFFWTDFVSGERVFPKNIFAESAYFTNGKPFWLEVKINKKILEKNLRIQNVYLDGVITPRKSDKMGKISGIKADIKMIRDILSTFSIFEISHQFYQFSRFSSRTQNR